MKKFLKTTLLAVVTIAAAFGLITGIICWNGPKHISSPRSVPAENMVPLEHDIYVSEALDCIYDGYKTGFDVSVGPTGWPVASSLKWEIALFEGNDAYYARLILHEYMLWWSWDDPYLLVKIPKKNVSGDPRNDEKFRWQMLWDITYVTARSYNYNPYIKDAHIQEINGHYVTFGYYTCSYYKYLVISDRSLDW